MPGTVLGAGDTALNKTVDSYFHGADIMVGVDK